jgi:cytosine/adenosine deaminase-related metal-dependent hydrolase
MGTTCRPRHRFPHSDSGGAKTTAFGESIGVLAPGKAADMVMIDWRQISYPYLDQETRCSTRFSSVRKSAVCAQ